MMMFEDNNNSGSEDDVFSKEGRRLTLRQVLNNDFQSKYNKAYLSSIHHLSNLVLKESILERQSMHLDRDS